MNTCSHNCIAACLTCVNYTDPPKSEEAQVKSKGLCTLKMDESVEVGEFHSCEHFECIDHEGV